VEEKKRIYIIKNIKHLKKRKYRLDNFYFHILIFPVSSSGNLPLEKTTSSSQIDKRIIEREDEEEETLEEKINEKNIRIKEVKKKTPEEKTNERRNIKTGEINKSERTPEEKAKGMKLMKGGCCVVM
jgi:hypothetical protein